MRVGAGSDLRHYIALRSPHPILPVGEGSGVRDFQNKSLAFQYRFNLTDLVARMDNGILATTLHLIFGNTSLSRDQLAGNF